MRPLKEKLQRLQCHFTWDFEVKDKMNIRHTLLTLALRLEHGPLRNRGTYLALKAYLHHLEGSPKEALATLQEAKEVLRKEPPGTFSRQVLLVYGNFAWIYYHLTDYDKVDLYLAQIRQICRDLSSPEPYSAPILEVYAQKGWSLLAMGFRNGQLAKECFQKALELQEPSVELQEGLAFSTFASWTHSYDDHKLQEKSRRLLEGLIRSHPENYEAKVYLAQTYRIKDDERAWHLADDVVQNSLNPELLRMAAKVYKFHSPSQAISTLKKAIALCGDYYLLHYDLGICYTDLLDRRSEGNRAEIMEDAIGCFRRSLEENPVSMFSRLKLANLYGERCQLYEEEVYLAVMEDLPTATKRCQQSFYLHWGDFLLKKGQRQAALRAYKACLEVPGDHPVEQKHLGVRLRELARDFHSEGDTEQGRVVHRLLSEMAAKHQGGPCCSAGLPSHNRPQEPAGNTGGAPLQP